MEARALPVRTNANQPGLGCELAEFTTSIMSPFFNSLRKGNCMPLILTATQVLPKSL